jgi:hypothetical protein
LSAENFAFVRLDDLEWVITQFDKIGKVFLPVSEKGGLEARERVARLKAVVEEANKDVFDDIQRWC